MAFVFSAWYFVVAALIAGIVACLMIFFRMDKKDEVMINSFIQENQAQEEPKVEEVPQAEVSETKAE